MKKLLIILLICVLCGLSTPLLQAGPSDKSGDRVIRIDAKPLYQIIEIIATVAKVNIVVNWNALEAVGIEKDVEISLHLRNINFKKLLQLVLDQANDGYTELGYTIDEDVIYISTKEDLRRRTKIKVYEIKDLLIKIPNFKGPRINLGNFGQGGQQAGGLGGGRFIEGGGQGGGGAGNQGGNITDDGDDGKVDNEDPSELLIDLIQGTIDPESWRVSGGNVGSVHILGSQLIVTQTSTAHQQLRDLRT